MVGRDVEAVSLGDGEVGDRIIAECVHEAGTAVEDPLGEKGPYAREGLELGEGGVRPLAARRAQDSRSVAVTLTEQGVELARLCTTRARGLNREFFAGVDAETQFDLLTDLASRAQGRRARAPE